MAPLDLLSGDLESQGHCDFEALYLVKVAYLGLMLLLNINRKSFMASPLALSNLTLKYFERPSVNINH